MPTPPPLGTKFRFKGRKILVPRYFMTAYHVNREMGLSHAEALGNALYSYDLATWNEVKHQSWASFDLSNFKSNHPPIRPGRREVSVPAVSFKRYWGFRKKAFLKRLKQMGSSVKF